jgi:hypothetical protein
MNVEVFCTRKCVDLIKPMEIVSLKGDNQGNKWPFSGLQTVRNVKVVCDITFVMYLLCCRDWEVKTESGLIHGGTSHLVRMVPPWQQIITITLYLFAFSSYFSLRPPTNQPQVVMVVPLLPFIIYKPLVLLNHTLNFV